jgi:hypothetical protein
MKRLQVRILILAAIITAAVLIFFRVSSPFGKGNSSFAVNNETEITKIELTQDSKKLVLSKDGDTWQINGKDEVRKSAVNFLLRVLSDIKIKSTVSTDLFKSEITKKNIIPVRVRVYEKGRVIKSFLVYKSGSNAYGNIMKMREFSKPFIVYVPGFEGDIGAGFSMDELFWKPFTVFNYLPSEIASVKFENLSDTISSFTIINKRSHFYLSGDLSNKTGWDSARVMRYISYFARVPFESWAFDLNPDEQKNIENSKPLYKITVSLREGAPAVLTMWAITIDGKTDSDRVYGWVEGKDKLFILRYFDIDPLIKKRDYFYGK